jgi:hypothetical protein
MNDKHLTRLDELIFTGSEVLKTRYKAEDHSNSGVICIGFPTEYLDTNTYTTWLVEINTFLKANFTNSAAEYINQIEEIKAQKYSNLPTKAEKILNLLYSIRQSLASGYLKSDADEPMVDCTHFLKQILDKFHKVTRQLRTRHDSRPTLDVSDEYDVQDLLHALLQIFFEDIRAEEWTPSYAGGSVRQDFLLKNEEIVIEVKKTRQSLTDRKLGEELIIDIEKYKEHPDCKRLVCFVYDSEGRLGNPIGIMNDLNNRHKDFAEVIIKP